MFHLLLVIINAYFGYIVYKHQTCQKLWVFIITTSLQLMFSNIAPIGFLFFVGLAGFIASKAFDYKKPVISNRSQEAILRIQVERLSQSLTKKF